MIRKSKTNGQETDTQNADTNTFRENERINAKIDDFIQKNPERWQYIQEMPRERVNRAMVLREVEKIEQKQKLDAGILRKLEGDPELKQTCENLVKKLPEDQRQKAMVSIARNILGRQAQVTQGGQSV